MWSDDCEEIAIPDISDGQVLIESEMASICGSDLHVVMMLALTIRSLALTATQDTKASVASSNRKFQDEEGQHVLTFPILQSVSVSMNFNAQELVTVCRSLTVTSRDSLLMAQQLGTVIYATSASQRLGGETVAVMGQGRLVLDLPLKQAGAAKVVVSDLSDTRLAMARSYGADVYQRAKTICTQL